MGSDHHVVQSWPRQFVADGTDSATIGRLRAERLGERPPVIIDEHPITIEETR